MSERIRSILTASPALIDKAPRDAKRWPADRYRFTADARSCLEAHGIADQEVWEVLHASRRLTRHLETGNTVAIFGVTRPGRHLVLFAAESVVKANVWDVTDAREMNTDEAGLFDHYVTRKQ